MDMQVNDTVRSGVANMEDGDGVWSPDIEEAFEEALHIYPPCGRRKIILSEEGKMYGRNELIARYIKMKTGKTRSRKQVSSHIQVLARKKQRDLQSKLKENPAAAQQLQQTLSGLSSAEIVSSSIRTSVNNNNTRQAMSFSGGFTKEQQIAPNVVFPDAYGQCDQQQGATYNGIARLRLALDYFSGFLEYPMGSDVHKFVEVNGSFNFADPSMECVDISQVADKFPDLYGAYRQGPAEAFFLVKHWVDMTYDPQRAGRILSENDTMHGMMDSSLVAVSSRFESLECLVIECTLAAVSLGRTVVEKVTTEEPRQDNGRFLYEMNKNPLCDYMIQFMQRLRSLDDISAMNQVLENFHIVMSVRNHSTSELLFAMYCVFEVAQPGLGCGHHVFKLIDQQDDIRRYTT